MVKNKVGFFCLNCLDFFGTKDLFKPHEKLCEIKLFYNEIMASEETKILEFNQFQTSYKAPFMYEDFEYIIEKTNGCKNNLVNSSTTKVSQVMPSGFSMPAISPFICAILSNIYGCN